MENMTGFKKLVLTVWDNPEFGSEMAYVIAKRTNYKVLLADLDLLAPKADLFLNVPKSPRGFKMAADSIDRRSFSPDVLLEATEKRRELDNLHILTGSYSLENYEYYRKEHLTELIDKAYEAFDVTILLVNKSIYDMFTCISLIKSDYNIIAVRADKDVIREFNSYLVFLRDKQHIPLGKSKFVAFEYGADANLSESVLNEITQENYLGNVRRNQKRQKYRNLKAPFARRLDGKTLDDYAKLLSPFAIFPKKRLVERLCAAVRRCRELCRQFRRITRR
jgi:cellulose biosynthesis protein BcsQ